MQVSPIRNYCSPSIPTHDDAENRPDLLQHIPTRWQTNPAVLTALASVTMLSATNAAIAGKAKAKPARVAPVFVHGEGRGSFGCVAISPPAYFSESEAQEVINNEAKRLGIAFESIQHDRSRPIPLDGIDKQRKIAYSFVSMQEGIIPNGTTAYESSSIDKARRAAKKASYKRGTYVVFYEPMAPMKARKRISGFLDVEERIKQLEAEEKTAKVKSEQQLRLQVQDFVKWLKAQGVI